MDKLCGRCGYRKPLACFHRRGNGHQSICIDCRKAVDAERWKATPGVHREIRKARLLRIAEWARALKDGPCLDCGGRFHFRAMQWDHVSGDKSDAISELVRKGRPKKVILAEIAKCELVCANCHAVRTYLREQRD